MRASTTRFNLIPDTMGHMTRRAADPQEPWRRLGRLLVQRREDLGYRRAVGFVRANGLKHRRIIDDLEKGRRDNYFGSTLADAERLYGWMPGSIAAVLVGGDPTPIDERIPEPSLRKRILGVLDLPVSEAAKLQVIRELVSE